MTTPGWVRSAALVVAVALSAVVLFTPSAGEGQPFPYADKVVHVGLFALLTGAAVWRFGHARTALLAVVAYAPVSELVQGLLLPGRSADPTDVVADLVGVAAVRLATGRSRGSAGAG